MATSNYWVIFVPTTKAGRSAVHQWQVREWDGTPDGIFRCACKTEAAAAEICDFLRRAYPRNWQGTISEGGGRVLAAENRIPDKDDLSATERAWREAQVECGLMNLQWADPIVIQEARAIFKRYVEGELTQDKVNDILNRLLEHAQESPGRSH